MRSRLYFEYDPSRDVWEMRMFTPPSRWDELGTFVPTPGGYNNAVNAFAQLSKKGVWCHEDYSVSRDSQSNAPSTSDAASSRSSTTSLTGTASMKQYSGSGEPGNARDTTMHMPGDPTQTRKYDDRWYMDHNLDSQKDKAQAPQDHIHPTGALRSERAPYYSAIPEESLRRLALRATGAPRGHTLQDRNGFNYGGGSDKYGYGNWTRGLEFEDTINHIVDHLLKWKRSIESGEVPKDDDLAAVAWGVMMPLMKFEYDYAYQFRTRANRRGRYGLEGNTHWDTFDDNAFPLLKPLSPRTK